MPPAVDRTANEPGPVRWREVVLYSLLAYAISWAWWAQLVVPRLEGVSLGRPLPDLASDPAVGIFAFGMFGPLIAATIMRLFVSREGVWGSVGVIRSWRWYAMAIAAPPVFVAFLILIDHVSGLGRFVWTREQPFFLVFPVGVVVSGLLLTPLTFGEEYGWRGYLLPRLLPMGEVRATLVVGAIWGMWHLPGLLVGLNYPGEPLWVSLLFFGTTTLLLSFPFTWAFVASRSVLIVAIMHATLNAATDVYVIPRYIPDGRPLITGGGGVIMIGLLAALVLVVQLVFRRRDAAKRKLA